MPSYLYVCTECGEKAAIEVGSSGDGKKACPKCGGNKLARLPSRFMAVKPSDGKNAPSGPDEVPKCH